MRFCLILLLLLIVSCPPLWAAPTLGQAGPVELVDDASRLVTIPALPRRIISLAPSVTELLFALGAGNEVVAITQACNYPPAALDRPRLGFATGAVEQMIMLEPELVIGMVGMVKPLVIEILDRQQIPLLLLEAKTLGDIYRHLRWIGRATGRLVEADRVITHLEAQREELTAQLSDVEAVPVFYVINDDPLITVGRDTFIHQLIEVAGGHNIAASATGTYPQFSVEEVLVANPAVILFAGGEVRQVSTKQRQFWQRWPMLRAVKNGRLFPVDSDLVSRPGPRVYLAAMQLAQFIHPERFSPMPPSEVTR